MAIPKEYVSYLANEMAERLGKSGKAKVQDKPAVSGKIQQAILDDFAQEEALNQEVRDYLEKYSAQIRRDAISYQEMYKLVKKELMKKHRHVSSSRPGEDGTKLNRDKVIELSHRIIKEFAAMGAQIELLEDKNEVRLEIVREFHALLRAEYQIDQAVRAKIKSQKREIAEGSAEWDILFRKYYSEEMRKLGAE
jgi:hypothetical protein